MFGNTHFISFHYSPPARCATAAKLLVFGKFNLFEGRTIKGIKELIVSRSPADNDSILKIGQELDKGGKYIAHFYLGFLGYGYLSEYGCTDRERSELLHIIEVMCKLSYLPVNAVILLCGIYDVTSVMSVQYEELLKLMAEALVVTAVGIEAYLINEYKTAAYINVSEIAEIKLMTALDVVVAEYVSVG